MIKIDNYLKRIYYDFKTTLLNKDCLVLGLSCGIDSVLVLQLLLNSVPVNKIKAYFIDINSEKDKQYLEFIKKQYQDKGLEIKEISLKDEYELLVGKFEVKKPTGFGNIQSKLRSMYLYSQALEHNGLVVNTLNYSEYYLGHFTKFGDSNGDLYPIVGIDKIDLYEIAQYLHLPKEIIDRKPTSGFFNQADDEEYFGFTYNQLHDYLMDKEICPEISFKIEKTRRDSEHKRKIIRPFIITKYNEYKN